MKEKENNRQVRNDSLNYLILWKTEKNAWKFNKSRQVFLLKNMYNVEKVPTKHFKILKKYIQSMQGKLSEVLLISILYGIIQKILEDALAIIEDPQNKVIFDDIEKSCIENEATPEAK